MLHITFEVDPFSRQVTRFLLVLEIAALVVVLGLSLSDQFFLAFVVSSLTFFLLVASLLLLYIRYRNLPIVREKRDLEHLVLKFQKNIQTEWNTIQAAVKQRDTLFQSEKREIQNALVTLQSKHIEHGLAAFLIKEAAIPGVGPKLKERLAGYGILSAAQVRNKISELPGFGEAKCQALMSWRRSILAKLEITKPSGLPKEQLDAIRQTYRALHDQNNEAERQARTGKQLLEHELISFRPRLQKLASINFAAYLSKSLASRGVVAALLAFLLICAQVVSSASAATSVIIASIPTATTTPTVTRMPTNTPAPTATAVKSQTFTPSTTNTPTLPLTATHTPLPTFTLRPDNTATSAPPAGGGGGTGNCHSSYPGVCIPPAPEMLRLRSPEEHRDFAAQALDCGDIRYRRFQVLSPDPHNFDRDGDGIGCES